jgi:hypothetical protein
MQWLARPFDAVRMMTRAAKPGGRVMVLDYNHMRTVHEPQPPATMRAFHEAFLRWRAQAGLDNEIADHLPEMFRSAGLRNVVEVTQLEVTRRIIKCPPHVCGGERPTPICTPLGFPLISNAPAARTR